MTTKTLESVSYAILMAKFLESYAVTVKALPLFNSTALLTPVNATLMSEIDCPIISEATAEHSLTTLTVIFFMFALPE